MAEEVNLDNLLLAPMDKTMARGAFSNSEEEFSNLVNWFKTAAFSSQSEKKSKTYVALYNQTVVGYITVSLKLIANLPSQPNTTNYEFEVVHIGKFLVSHEFRSLGIGKRLLDLALDIAVNINDMVGCVGIIVDANNNERTINFYEKHGFIKIDENTEDRTVQMFFRLDGR